jgi:hypothetical protein
VIPFFAAIHQCSGRTYFHAGAAKGASRLDERFAEGATYISVGSPTIESDSLEAQYFLVDPNASPAENAYIVIAYNERILHFHGQSFWYVGVWHYIETDKIDNFLKLTVPVLRARNTSLGHRHVPQAYVEWLATLLSPAGKAFMRMPGESHFHDFTAKAVNFRRVAVNNHAVGCRFTTCGYSVSPAFYLDLAQPAGTERKFNITQCTQVGDVNTCIQRRFQNPFALDCFNFYAVYS